MGLTKCQKIRILFWTAVAQFFFWGGDGRVWKYRGLKTNAMALNLNGFGEPSLLEMQMEMGISGWGEISNIYK